MADHIFNNLSPTVLKTLYLDVFTKLWPKGAPVRPALTFYLATLLQQIPRLQLAHDTHALALQTLLTAAKHHMHVFGFPLALSYMQCAQRFLSQDKAPDATVLHRTQLALATCLQMMGQGKNAASMWEQLIQAKTDEADKLLILQERLSVLAFLGQFDDVLTIASPTLPTLGVALDSPLNRRKALQQVRQIPNAWFKDKHRIPLVIPGQERSHLHIAGFALIAALHKGQSDTGFQIAIAMLRFMRRHGISQDAPVVFMVVAMHLASCGPLTSRLSSLMGLALALPDSLQGADQDHRVQTLYYLHTQFWRLPYPQLIAPIEQCLKQLDIEGYRHMCLSARLHIIAMTLYSGRQLKDTQKALHAFTRTFDTSAFPALNTQKIEIIQALSSLKGDADVASPLSQPSILNHFVSALLTGFSLDDLRQTELPGESGDHLTKLYIGDRNLFRGRS